MLGALALAVVFCLVSAVGEIADATPLDIVGIKVGMPLPAAIDILKAHNPRITHVYPLAAPPPGATQYDKARTRAFAYFQRAEFKGLPPFTWLVRAQIEDLKGDTPQEEIEIRIAPGSPEIVVSVFRKLSYPRGKERAIAALTASLKEKYGTEPIASSANSETQLVWYYDPNGKPKQPVNRNCDARSAGQWAVEGALSYALNGPASPELDTAKNCGAYSYARMTQSANQDMTREMAVTVTDMALTGARYKAASEIIANAARRQREQEMGEAAKRSKDKL